MTKRNTRADKTFAFKGNPSYLKILQQGNVDAVSFANNHCRDYGEGSYNDTIAVFKKNKMPFASYGKVSVYKTKGKKIGMIAVNGLDGVSSSERFINSGIKKLKKKKADLIVVSMHAGIEKTSVIMMFRKLSHTMQLRKGQILSSATTLTLYRALRNTKVHISFTVLLISVLVEIQILPTKIR